MTASEIWWLIAAIAAGLAAVAFLAVIRPAGESTPMTLDRVGRFLAAGAIGCLAMGFLVLP